MNVKRVAVGVGGTMTQENTTRVPGLFFGCQAEVWREIPTVLSLSHANVPMDLSINYVPGFM